MKQILPGVWKRGRQFLTISLVPGSKEYGKPVIISGKEYRIWDQNKSKAAAAIAKGLKEFPIETGSKVLYLGIASGSTASFFSDIIGPSGVIYGVEISERAVRDLNHVAEKRGNIVPIIANAREPGTYSWIEKVDVVYQDVAIDDQSEVLIRNCRAFLKPGGFAMIAIKSRSINVVRNPKEVYKEELKKLRKVFEIVDNKELDPFEKDHMFVLAKWK